ncbi:Hypothetical predicted protein [Mytilus galloprovincialis]|uniref:LolA-like domain-containing protein n=1 Tax=Mytilus galloprovincialis TaxID=29158 RepID=A0A8B6F248_MYTGA|nr:Hypothetical predicted protein [Mytilus galloprovincialis]
MTKYVAVVLVVLFANFQQISAEVFGFDNSVCTYIKNSEGGPMPSWSIGYSTDVEWKMLGKKTVVDVKEFWDPIDEVRSITASIEGVTVQNIISDKHTEYYTIVNNKCTVNNLETEMIFFPDIYGLQWLTMTKDWYKIMRQTTKIQNSSTVIRSMDVDHWSSCLYVLNFDITAHVDIYFAKDWALPQNDPNVFIPVRIEVRGRINGTDSNAFHVVGDLYNFNASPPADPLNLQAPAGIFCPGKYPGKPIIKLPDSFYGIIEIVNREQSTINFQEIWYHADQKIIRYDTKTSDGSDSDPYMTILDFKTGIRYKIDKYIGNCETELVVVGDNFVKAKSLNSNNIAIMSVTEFFHLAKAYIQYVGKRLTRGILCDVWVGTYFDDSVSRNFTAEWYFAAQGWTEAVGLILQTGSFIKMDIFGGAQYPMSYQIHRMDPIEPSLSSFDLYNCFKPAQKAHVVARFSVSRGKLISQISQLYLQDILQAKLTDLAQIDSSRMTNILMEYYDGNEFYFSATLLDKAPLNNPRLIPPAIYQVPLFAAFDFLRVQIEGKWSQNVSTSTGDHVTFYGVNIVQLNYQAELTTTTAPTTPTLPYNVPTLPHPTTPHTTKVHTPPIPPSVTTERTTITPFTPTTPPTVSSTLTTQITSRRTATPKPCMCPKITCPPAQTQTPLPPSSCPPTVQEPSAKPTKLKTQMPIKQSTVTLKQPTKSNQNCSALIRQMQLAADNAKKSTTGVSKGGAAGIGIAMLIAGAVMGFILTRFYHVKWRRNNPGLINDMEDNNRY